jgi:hypothetical protein
MTRPIERLARPIARSRRPVSPPRRAIGLVVLCAVVQGWPAMLSGELIFDHDLDLQTFCEWSAVTTACVEEVELEGELTGLTIPYCVPRQSGTFTGGSYTVCPTSFCADGVTEGCQTYIHVAAVDLDLGLHSLFADLVGDDVDLPVQITTIGSTTCTLEVRDATAESESALALAGCFPGLLLMTGVNGTWASATATFSMPATNPTCALAAGQLGFVGPSILGAIETALEDALPGIVEEHGNGRFFCAPPE